MISTPSDLKKAIATGQDLYVKFLGLGPIRWGCLPPGSSWDKNRVNDFLGKIPGLGI